MQTEMHRDTHELSESWESIGNKTGLRWIPNMGAGDNYNTSGLGEVQSYGPSHELRRELNSLRFDRASYSICLSAVRPHEVQHVTSPWNAQGSDRNTGVHGLPRILCASRCSVRCGHGQSLGSAGNWDAQLARIWLPILGMGITSCTGILRQSYTTGSRSPTFVILLNRTNSFRGFTGRTDTVP